jgi:hypothetical protein
VVFVEYDNSTVESSTVRGLYRSIQGITEIELGENSSDFFKLVPASDPLGRVQVLPAAYGFNKPVTNYSGLKVIFINVDYSRTELTDPMLDLYNVTVHVIEGNNSCNATVKGKNILGVQLKGSVSLRAFLVGFTDSTYSVLKRLQSYPATVEAVQTEGMQSGGYPAYTQPLNMQDIADPDTGVVTIHSIQCSSILYEMYRSILYLRDSDHILHRVHEDAYAQFNFTIATAGSSSSCIQQSRKDPSVFYGVATGSAQLIIQWRHGSFGDTLDADVTLEDPVMLVSLTTAYMHNNNTLVGAKGSMNAGGLIYATFAIYQGTFLSTERMINHIHEEHVGVMVQKPLLILSLPGGNDDDNDNNAGRSGKVSIHGESNMLVLEENTIVPVNIQVKARSPSCTGPLSNCPIVEGRSICNWNTTGSAVLQVYGNVLLLDDGDFDMGSLQGSGQPLPHSLIVPNRSSFTAQQQLSQPSMSIPIYTRLGGGGRGIIYGTLKAFDIAIFFDRKFLRAAGCAPGQYAPQHFMCNMDLPGRIRIVALDSAGSHAGEAMHVATITLQAQPINMHNVSRLLIPLEGRRYHYIAGTDVNGSLPCKIAPLPLEDRYGNKSYCPFVAGGNLSVVIESASSNEQQVNTRQMRNDNSKNATLSSFQSLHAAAMIHGLRSHNPKGYAKEGVPSSSAEEKAGSMFWMQQKDICDRLQQYSLRAQGYETMKETLRNHIQMTLKQYHHHYHHKGWMESLLASSRHHQVNRQVEVQLQYKQPVTSKHPKAFHTFPPFQAQSRHLLAVGNITGTSNNSTSNNSTSNNSTSNNSALSDNSMSLTFIPVAGMETQTPNKTIILAMNAMTNMSMATLLNAGNSTIVLGDVNKDNSFDVRDALMYQDFHLLNSSSSFALHTFAMQESLTTKQLYPIGSNNRSKEFHHALHTLAEKQVFVSKVSISEQTGALNISVSLSYYNAHGQRQMMLDAGISFNVTFAIQTKQWWMFHRLLAGQTGSITSMMYDEIQQILYIQGISSIINEQAITWSIGAALPDSTARFPVSVNYALAWDHNQNFMPEANISIAFLVQPIWNAVRYGNGHDNNDAATNTTTSTSESTASHEFTAEYLSVPFHHNATNSKPPLEAYATMNLTANQVCYGYLDVLLHSTPPEGSRQFQTVNFTEWRDMATVVFGDIDFGLTDFLEARVHYVLSLTLNITGRRTVHMDQVQQLQHTNSTSAQDVMPEIPSLSIQDIQSMVHWDTWIFLPFQCFSTVVYDMDNPETRKILRLTYTEARLQNVQASQQKQQALQQASHQASQQGGMLVADYHLYAINVSVAVGIRSPQSGSSELAHASLVSTVGSMIGRSGTQTLQVMVQHGFEHMYGDLWKLQPAAKLHLKDQLIHITKMVPSAELVSIKQERRKVQVKYKQPFYPTEQPATTTPMPTFSGTGVPKKLSTAFGILAFLIGSVSNLVY